MYFDAAWGNEDTQILIDILEEYDVKATFFVVGQWVDKYPESVKALHDAGHEIMNHSNTHPHLPQLSHDQIIEEISECDNKIENVTGVRPNMTRVPYGDYSDKVVSTLREINHYTIQWNIDSLDWQDLSPGEIYERVIGKAESGSIVLFHNAAKNTPEALPMIIKELQRQEYDIIPLSELIYTEDFTVEHDGKQVKEKGANEKGANEKGANEKGANEKGANKEEANKEGINEKGINEKGIIEKGENEKKVKEN